MANIVWQVVNALNNTAISMNVNPRLKEIASWRIACELFRRYPDQFHLIETHPGGGQYDCLDFYEKNSNELVASFNRRGRLHIYPMLERHETLHVWPMMVEKSTREVLDEICRKAKLPIPSQVPPSTPEVLVYRFIAGLLTHSVFGLNYWECRNGFFDHSGAGDCFIREEFEAFPEAKKLLLENWEDDHRKNPSYRFWFILCDREPIFCLEKRGVAFNIAGKKIDLLESYNETRQIWSVIYSLAEGYLP
ncbi:MAG: hypothetical protein SCH71_09750 [Desulfobulbaceae bacterium]|nr:hypothetical protein [Desulfobulbaceae bacterium]